ncbi:uncharacterized protein K441DRAFT_665536 [Cenococcum geophilum 1.58]|uniref:uncharacterized protein n=1 Tax=Cenococcum geophilum 1.58 TaxID=794803 RepID=UPI00358EC222|nr:hypothetical protein K441DRAFT_665536 [Cenococcum geophilum 1.58]
MARLNQILMRFFFSSSLLAPFFAMKLLAGSRAFPYGSSDQKSFIYLSILRKCSNVSQL